MEEADSCIVILLQCRDREWWGINNTGREAWAWEAASRCLEAGFAVLRVRTDDWDAVKRQHPEWFRPCFKENCDRQQVICSVNYIRFLCPTLQNARTVLESDCGNVAKCREAGLDIHVPEGTKRVATDLYCVCEASSNIAPTLTPKSLRQVYAYYPEPIIWCGFNMAAQFTGSKGLVGDASSLLLMGDVLSRLKLYHIDQTYKALRGPFMALVEKNRICFGYLRHRSQCCDSSKGNSQAMSAEDYTPTPVIPEGGRFFDKRRFTVDTVLRSTLHETTRVRKPIDCFDIVALRLQSYMFADDPIFTENEGAVLRELDEIYRSVETNRIANACVRLDELLESAEGDAHGDLGKAVAAANRETEAAEASGDDREEQENEVLSFCKDRGWLRESENQWLCVAMMRRGLTRHSSQECLTCCGKQLWDFTECYNHYTKYKNEHLEQRPSIADLASIIERGHEDDTKGTFSLLQQYYGRSAVQYMTALGWQRGQQLGRQPGVPQTSFSTWDKTSHPQFHRTLASTRKLKDENDKQVLRDGRCDLVPLNFRAGEDIAESKTTLSVDLKSLNFHDFVEALVGMTELAFSEGGEIHKFSDEAVPESFGKLDWDSRHEELSLLHRLPVFLQRGMQKAGNGDLWTSIMTDLLRTPAQQWVQSDETQQLLRTQVGKLWKTMEVAMNNAELTVPFCVFSSSMIMSLLEQIDSPSRMTFTPLLSKASQAAASSAEEVQGEHFVPRVRYRGKGLDPAARYTKPSKSQRDRRVLLRPFAAAQGIPPPPDTKKRKREESAV